MVAGLLGPVGSTEGHKLWPLNVLATTLVSLAAFVLITTLMPKSGWRWGVDIKRMLMWLEDKKSPATAAVLRRTRAYYIAEDIEINQKRLDRMGDYFGIAASLFAAAVLAWLIEIAAGAP